MCLQVSKLINEVYHSYNRHQYPFTCLSIGLEADLLDVNVTPDKRRVLMQRESLLLATLKASLSAMFEETLNQLPANLSQEYLPGESKRLPIDHRNIVAYFVKPFPGNSQVLTLG